MEELSDKDFDQIFKNRIKEGYLEYEEESWLKMEAKLRSRNRFVFLRNASIILLFLSFGLGIYLISGETIINKPSHIARNIAHDSIITDKKKLDVDEKLAILAGKNTKNSKGNLTLTAAKKTRTIAQTRKRVGLQPKNNSFNMDQEIASTSAASTSSQNASLNSSTIETPNQVVAQTNLNQDPKNDVLVKVSTGEDINTPRKSKPITLSINIGPDFNSTKNAVGGKSGFAVGIGINVPLIKKFSIQTGVNYGSKNYEAKGYDYTFNNPNTMNLISGIEAACKVLEVPLRASYTIIDNQRNSIDLNAGLSSYMMLKENYRFIYTASARKDRFLEEKNANQHYLSVIDLSASYNIKLKNRKFALGVQPYVKIPLSGIGEGSVPLKSSGISLKLNYEINNKK